MGRGVEHISTEINQLGPQDQTTSVLKEVLKKEKKWLSGSDNMAQW